MKRAGLDSTLKRWQIRLAFFVLASSVGAIIVRWFAGGQVAVNRFVDGRAAAVADTVARRVVHDSLSTDRHRYRRHHH